MNCFLDETVSYLFYFSTHTYKQTNKKKKKKLQHMVDVLKFNMPVFLTVAYGNSVEPD